MCKDACVCCLSDPLEDQTEVQGTLACLKIGRSADQQCPTCWKRRQGEPFTDLFLL